MATSSLSPTSTASSVTSSLDMLSDLSCSFSSINSNLTSDYVSSDDEIVWGVSEDSTSTSNISTETSISPASDDDFIVLSRPRSYEGSSSDSGASTPSIAGNSAPSATVGDLVSGLSRLDVEQLSSRQTPIGVRKVVSASQSRKRKKISPRRGKAARYAYPSPTPSPPIKHSPAASKLTPAQTFSKVPGAKPDNAKNAKKPKKVKKKVAATAPSRAPANTGLGARPIVDDASDIGPEDSAISISMYDEAARYISAFLSNPAESSASRLTLLQSLIIELGLCNPRSCSLASTSLLPGTLTAAKAFLKSRAFLNIREYLAVREKGQAALQTVMHSSRSALIRDIRKKGNPASLKWVKEHGLQVLLVTCY